MSSWIKIGDPTLEGNRVENNLVMSPNLKLYFKYTRFYVEYDEQIDWNPSILNIPVVASLIALTWLTGATLNVGDLDKTFAESLEQLRREYERMYPGILTGQMVVRRIIENESKSRGMALFFSGGLDSTYSLFQLKEHNPRLIMIGGFDVYMDTHRAEMIWRTVKDIYRRFAEEEHLTLNFIRTNSRVIIREDLVNNEYYYPLKLTIWDAIRHAVLLIGLAAPLSVSRFDKLVISASRTDEHPTTLFPYASAPNTDEKIAWAGLRVIHYGRVHRYEKVRGLLMPLREGRITLNVCFKLLDKLNCSQCEKCGRVMTSLMAEGIDPNTCGFKVDVNTLRVIRNSFDPLIKWRYRLQLHWTPWINNLPDDVPDLYGIREFIDFMRKFKDQVV